MKWAISRPLAERLHREAKAAGNSEICGLLIGEEGRIDDAVPVRNAAPHPEREFLLDPAEHLRRSREKRQSGRRIVGCYHSHPSGDARPSSADLAGAFEAGFQGLILADGQAALWSSRGGGARRHAFEPIGLEIR
jgi:proteasome lid subunit RPN8/RPN11